MAIVRALLLFLLAGSANAGQLACTPIKQWQAVPDGVRQDLERTVGRVAEKGDRFNATDVVFADLAASRFLAGCQSTDLTAVALERGGRGYHIEVFQYVSGKILKRWKQQLDLDGTATVNLLDPPDAR